MIFWNLDILVFYARMMVVVSSLKMNEEWSNAPILRIDAWLFENLDIWGQDDFFFFFFFKMDEAWPNAPSSTINVNFEKSYCVGIFNKAKFEEKKIKITKLGKTIVDTVFCQPSICVLDLEKPKNIIFSPWGHENIYSGVVQPVWTPEHLKCLFQPKWPKCPLSTFGWPKVKHALNPHKTTFFTILDQTRAPQRFLATLTKFDPELTLGGPQKS